MEKPITVARQDFSNKLAELINESNLHPLIILPVLAEVTGQIEYALNQLTEKERMEYEEAMKNADSDQSDENRPSTVSET